MRSLKESRVLVTGANGFIGSHLTEKLVNLGANISVIIKPESNTDNIRNILNKIKVFRADLRDYNSLSKIVSSISPEYIFHLAANVNVARDIKELDKASENILMFINLIKSLEKINYELLINTGTVEEYGNGKAPFKESQLPSPISPYSASKVAITNYARMLYGTHKLPITTVRVFLTYGPRQTGYMLIPSLITTALLKKDFKMTKGEQTREFNYVDDIVDGYLTVASNPKKVMGEIINVGNGKEYKVSEVVDKIVKLSGNKINIDKSLPYREGEVMHVYCDNSKIKKLGWKPKYNLDEGLKRTVEWYKKEFKNG